MRPALDRRRAHSFSVTSGERVARRDWWDACEADPAATFFATPDWAEILTSAFRSFYSHPFLFSFPDGGRCLSPAIEVRRLRGRLAALHSMPFGTYGGIVGPARPGGDAREAAAAFLAEESRRRFQTSIYPNPLAPGLPAPLTTHAGTVHAVDLTRGWEAWWSGLDPKVRYSMRKARRRGVEVRSAMDAAAFADFYERFARVARAWTISTPFDRRFFASVWAHRSPRMQLWTAYRAGRVVAGMLVFRFQRQASVFLSFIADEERPHAAKHAIYTELVRDACEAGYARLNLLGSGGNPRVESFKRSVGGRACAYRYLHRRVLAHRVAAEPVRWVRRRGRYLLHLARPEPALELEDGVGAT